ncbi:MAG: hypothetical protein HZB15_01790 [Actinobacteria bacterium]|nr:hypothetical protein [Actinomycetota bacterium]
MLAPPAGSEMQLVSVQDWDTSGVASGAVLAPDGTVFSIYVGPGPTWMPDAPDWEAIPANRRGLDDVAGHEVAAIVDASAPGQIYRTVRDGCWSIEIVTADAPMWDDDLTTLIGAITANRDVQGVDEAAVTVDVPDGWSSLGAGRMLRSWTMELHVDLDGTTHDVHLAQRPNAPVGVLLSGESNPVPFEHNGQHWWAVDAVTTPGVTSVIGDAGFGAFHISSDLPAARLVEIIDELVPTRDDQLPGPESPGATVDSVAEGATEPSTDTIAPTGGAIPSGTRCGVLGVGLDLVDS